MKKINLILLSLPLLGIYQVSNAQSNTFPANGNVGIGTVTPSSLLHVWSTPPGWLITSRAQAVQPGDINGLKFMNGYNNETNKWAGIGAIAETLHSNGTGLVLYTATTEKVRITSSGNVGIGTTSPSQKVHVIGNVLAQGGLVSANPNNSGATASVSWLNNVARIRVGGTGDGASGGFDIQGLSDQSLMRLLGNGNVGIGITNPTAKLAVNGVIRSKEVKVETANWADYVFRKDYQLPALSEIESYIQEYQHLPGIPSEEEVKKEGISLGEMNKKLLEKVEELTLMLIENEKKRNGLEERVQEQESKIKHLEQSLIK